MADHADLARELLGLAADDLMAARALVGVPAVSDAIVGFHAQQTAEKASKAVLAAAGRSFPYTHNIAVLMQLCEDAGIELPAALDELDLLTPYGVAGGYGARSRHRGSPGRCGAGRAGAGVGARGRRGAARRQHGSRPR
jgi:HEPN domain-containing protein